MANYIEVFEKSAAAERVPKSIDYADRMPSGATLSSCTVSAVILPAGTADNSVISSTTATVSGTAASVFVRAGVAGFRYAIRFTATLSDTTVLPDELLMIVTA